MKEKRVLRYYCDFCKKSGCGKGAMRKADAAIAELDAEREAWRAFCDEWVDISFQVQAQDYTRYKRAEALSAEVIIERDYFKEHYELVFAQRNIAEAALAARAVTVTIDDDIVFYLNGEELLRVPNEHKADLEAERDKYKWQRDYVVDIAEEYGGCDFSDLDRRWEDQA